LDILYAGVPPGEEIVQSVLLLLHIVFSHKLHTLSNLCWVNNFCILGFFGHQATAHAYSDIGGSSFSERSSFKLPDIKVHVIKVLPVHILFICKIKYNPIDFSLLNKGCSS